MATIQNIELIHVSEHYTGTQQEIKRVWSLISCKPTITTRQIADEIHTSRTRVYHIIAFLKLSGCISNAGKRRAWDVRLPYVEI